MCPLFDMTNLALCHREQLPLEPAPRLVSLASLTSALSIFFGEWLPRLVHFPHERIKGIGLFRCLLFARRFLLFAFQLCFQEFVGYSHGREHSQLLAIGRVGFVGNRTHRRIDVFSELQNVVGIAATQNNSLS